MAKTVLFHIGSVKTGTTAVQKFCHENRDKLLANDIDYIQFQPPRLELPRWANADALLDLPHNAEAIAAKVRESPASRVLISEEGLMTRPDVWQHPLFRDHRRVVVFYLRDAIEVISAWAAENSYPYNFAHLEHASGRGIVPIDAGLDFWTTEYRCRLLDLLDAFAADRDLEVRVRPYAAGTGAVPDLLAAAGLSVEAVGRLVAGSGGNDVLNPGRSRRYCDASWLLFALSQQCGRIAAYGESMVREVSAVLDSGDPRKVADTLNQEQANSILRRLRGPLATFERRFGVHSTRADGKKPGAVPPYQPIDLLEMISVFRARYCGPDKT